MLTLAAVLFASAGKNQMRVLPHMSVLTRIRAVALIRGVYNMRHIGSTRFNDIAGPVSKICSLLLPIIMVTVPFAPALDNQGILCLILTCTPSTFLLQRPYRRTSS